MQSRVLGSCPGSSCSSEIDALSEYGTAARSLRASHFFDALRGQKVEGRAAPAFEHSLGKRPLFPWSRLWPVSPRWLPDPAR